MERDSLVGQSRTMEVKHLLGKERQQQSKASVKKVEAPRDQPQASKSTLQSPSPRELRSRTSHLLKRPTTKVDPWAVGRTLG